MYLQSPPLPKEMLTEITPDQYASVLEPLTNYERDTLRHTLLHYLRCRQVVIGYIDMEESFVPVFEYDRTQPCPTTPEYKIIKRPVEITLLFHYINKDDPELCKVRVPANLFPDTVLPNSDFHLVDLNDFFFQDLYGYHFVIHHDWHCSILPPHLNSPYKAAERHQSTTFVFNYTHQITLCPQHFY